MARKTVDELEKEQLAALNKNTDEAHAVKKATMQDNVKTYNQQVDASVAQQTGIYEDNIRDVERAEKAQLDYNHLDELVARKNLENTTADMGLTDSGLNRSQQTAISVMRGNADSKTRQGAADNVRSLKDAMDQVMIEGEQKKTSYAQQQSSALSEWYQNQMLANKQNARSAAVEQYNAETEAIEKERQSRLDEGYVQQEDGSWVKDNTAEMYTYAMTLIKEGVSPDEAWTEAQYRYGSKDDKNTLRAAAKKAGYSEAAAEAYANAGGGEAGEAAAHNKSAEEALGIVSAIQVKVDRGLKSSAKLGEEISGVVRERLDKQSKYLSLGQLGQSYALSYAIAVCVANSCSGMTEEKVFQVLQAACEAEPNADYESAKEYLSLTWKPNNIQAKALVTRR